MLCVPFTRDCTSKSEGLEMVRRATQDDANGELVDGNWPMVRMEAGMVIIRMVVL